MSHSRVRFMENRRTCTIGVLSLQGAFKEHVELLQLAFTAIANRNIDWKCIEVRSSEQLDACFGLVIPGGESTSIALVASRSGLLEPLRSFVKVQRKPTWGTCAGLILLSEAANRTKSGGQDLIGGLDIRVDRNHFGRQTDSFEAPLELPFLTGNRLANATASGSPWFKGVFIRAPVVERLLTPSPGPQTAEGAKAETVVAPSRSPVDLPVSELLESPVQIMAVLESRFKQSNETTTHPNVERDDIVAVMQNNVFATSFHPELTGDPRLHVWWLQQVRGMFEATHSGATDWRGSIRKCPNS